MVSPTASSYLDSHNLLAAPLPPHTKHPDTSRIQIACSKTFFPKTWFSKPKLLNLNSALWNLHLQNPPNRPHTSRKLTLEMRVQYIRNLPLSDGNLRNPMCERRPHGQPGNQEARRVEFTKAYRFPLGEKETLPSKNKRPHFPHPWNHPKKKSCQGTATTQRQNITKSPGLRLMTPRWLGKSRLKAINDSSWLAHLWVFLQWFHFWSWIYCWSDMNLLELLWSCYEAFE